MKVCQSIPTAHNCRFTAVSRGFQINDIQSKNDKNAINGIWIVINTIPSGGALHIRFLRLQYNLYIKAKTM
jgi:hypothetical protein